MSAAGQPDGTTREVEIRLLAGHDHVGLTRIVVAAIATEADLGFDRVADLRLAVDEVVSRLVLRSSSTAVPITGRVVAGDDAVVVSLESKDAPEDLYDEGDFGWQVLTALTDGVAIIREPNSVSESEAVRGITLTVNRDAL
ncbi:MAG: anti-sigma factor [Mycobacterium sp.]